MAGERSAGTSVSVAARDDIAIWNAHERACFVAYVVRRRTARSAAAEPAAATRRLAGRWGGGPLQRGGSARAPEPFDCDSGQHRGRRQIRCGRAHPRHLLCAAPLSASRWGPACKPANSVWSPSYPSCASSSARSVLCCVQTAVGEPRRLPANSSLPHELYVCQPLIQLRNLHANATFRLVRTCPSGSRLDCRGRDYVDLWLQVTPDHPFNSVEVQICSNRQLALSRQSRTPKVGWSGVRCCLLLLRAGRGRPSFVLPFKAVARPSFPSASRRHKGTEPYTSEPTLSRSSKVAGNVGEAPPSVASACNSRPEAPGADRPRHSRRLPAQRRSGSQHSRGRSISSGCPVAVGHRTHDRVLRSGRRHLPLIHDEQS